jgi:CubicO group peptidase (beta-lactamase class C family)
MCLTTGVLSVLLNDGTDAKTGTKLLEKATVDEMFRNQIPQFPDLGRQGIPAAKPELTNPIAELYPVPGSPPQGWGLSFMLTGSPTGRSETAGWWAGLSNMYWWADREHGVAGIVGSQILPFADASVMGMWVNLELAVYRGLGVTSA